MGITIDMFYDWGIAIVEAFGEFSQFLNMSIVDFFQQAVNDFNIFGYDFPWLTETTNQLIIELTKLNFLANMPLIIWMLGGAIVGIVLITLVRNIGDLFGF